MATQDPYQPQVITTPGIDKKGMAPTGSYIYRISGGKGGQQFQSVGIPLTAAMEGNYALVDNDDDDDDDLMDLGAHGHMTDKLIAESKAKQAAIGTTNSNDADNDDDDDDDDNEYDPVGLRVAKAEILRTMAANMMLLMSSVVGHPTTTN